MIRLTAAGCGEVGLTIGLPIGGKTEGKTWWQLVVPARLLI